MLNKKNEFQYETIEKIDIDTKALDCFERYQLTNTIYVMKKSIRNIEKGKFESDWDLCKKREVVQELNAIIRQGGAIEVAYDQGNIIGFAALSTTFFGAENQYLELIVIQVSKAYRNRGIGQVLMSKIKEQARIKGAKKIYISGHPAVESVSFYEKMGAKPAMEINQKIALAEPDDLQLEIDLYDIKS
jgi:predicted N-acetyltransferase YhbS